jgi:hypothetical protein
VKKQLLSLAVLVAVLGAGCSNSPAGTADGSGSPAATRSAALKFAGCMRDNGVSQFPDPDASGTYTADGLANQSKLDTDSPAWKKAIAACKDLEPAGFTGYKRSSEQQAAALTFAQCIREHGVTDFPDPEPDAPMVDTNRIPSSNSEGGMAALNAAMHTCGTYAAQAGTAK